MHGNYASYTHRIVNNWNKYYLNTPIIKTPVKKLTPLQLAESDFHESGYTACLAVALCFQIGVRIGESVALKWADISEEKKELSPYSAYGNKKHTQMGDGSWKCAGYEKDEYIFVGKDGQRIHSKALDTRIRKYCRYIGIGEKSMHKIRKTYISTLIDSRTVNLNTIRDFAGHEDERTTLKCNCFNRQTDSQTQESIERALSL